MCLAMFIYMRSIVFTKQTAGEILSVYQKYPVLKRGDYLDELIALAWTVCEELRLENSNLNNSNTNNSNLNNVNNSNLNNLNQNSSNQFDVNDKFKDMKFMNKTVSQEQKV